MSSPLIRGSFNHHEEEDLYSPGLAPPRTSRKTSPSSTPPRRRSSKTNTKDSSSKNNNPYSTRGLDKFSALLSDLEQKKQKIYSQKDSQNISMVRFAYSSSSNDVVPIVIKAKDKDQAKAQEDGIKQSKPTTPISAAFDNKYPIDESSARVKDSKESCLESEKKTEKINIPGKINLGNLRHPSYYVPAVIIFILVSLTVFGRPVAILLTSLGWYIVPALPEDTLKSKRRPRKKKDYVRRSGENMIASDGLQTKELVRKVSEIKMVSDGLPSTKSEIINNVCVVKTESPHAHRKSW